MKCLRHAAARCGVCTCGVCVGVAALTLASMPSCAAAAVAAVAAVAGSNAWMPRTTCTPICAATNGSSPKVSYTRAQRGLVAMPRMGEKSHGTPAARVSLDPMRPNS
eukprot:scaffold55905_cov57-Phaeocystis_antarctica.AAC.5